MVIDLGILFFVLLGSKIVLGVVVVYLLLPRDATCVICDAETLPIQHARGTGRVLRVLRLHRRWCMECERETLSRPLPSRVPERRPLLPVAESRFR